MPQPDWRDEEIKAFMPADPNDDIVFGRDGPEIWRRLDAKLKREKEKQIIGEHGIMVLPQGAWESLDPANRAHVGELARERKIVVLTAEATDGELRAEVA